MWRAPWREWDLLTSLAARQPGWEIAPRSPSETKAEHRGTLPLLGGRVPGSAENRCSNTVSRVKAPGSAVRTAERAETTRRASADRQPEATGAAHRGRHSVSNARSPGKTPRPDGRRAQGAGARPRPAGPRPRERPRGQVAEAPGGGGGGTGGDHVLVRGTPGAMK